ncbi:MAG: cytosol nonspecific dipeptidase, partial [Paludibacteraceae bacterium]|nr:cytosol nonspecific dipeptidase [Paludibacteraceae bacterium]
MEGLDKLASRDIWRYFSDICEIPHPSKREGRLVQHIKRFGESLGLETMVDEIGNVLIRKPATEGMEG